jgi:hypothetical protein
MAPLAPSNTARFRFHYSAVTLQHTFQIRSGASPAAVGTFVGALHTALGNTLFLHTITSVDWAPAGSDIFNPVVTGIEGTSYGSGAGSDFNEPWALTFVGRTAGGRRARISLFGFTTLSGNYRVAPGEMANVDAAIAVLQGAGSNCLGIDGLVPVWRTYANVSVNDHWVKEGRA